MMKEDLITSTMTYIKQNDDKPTIVVTLFL